MHPSIQRYDRNAGARCFEATTDFGSDRPGKQRSDAPVRHERVSVLALQAALILPWDTLGVRSVLAEAVRDPGVGLEVILKEVKVLNFLLLRGKGRWTHLEHLISFFRDLIEPLASLIVEAILFERVVIRGIELAWHFV